MHILECPVRARNVYPLLCFRRRPPARCPRLEKEHASRHRQLLHFAAAKEGPEGGSSERVDVVVGSGRRDAGHVFAVAVHATNFALPIVYSLLSGGRIEVKGGFRRG